MLCIQVLQGLHSLPLKIIKFLHLPTIHFTCTQRKQLRKLGSARLWSGRSSKDCCCIIDFHANQYAANLKQYGKLIKNIHTKHMEKFNILDWTSKETRSVWSCSDNTWKINNCVRLNIQRFTRKSLTSPWYYHVFLVFNILKGLSYWSFITPNGGNMY